MFEKAIVLDPKYDDPLCGGLRGRNRRSRQPTLRDTMFTSDGFQRAKEYESAFCFINSNPCNRNILYRATAASTSSLHLQTSHLRKIALAPKSCTVLSVRLPPS